MASAPAHVQNLDEALQLNIYVGECQRVLTGDVRKRIQDAERELQELLKVRKAGDKGTTKIINNVEFTAADRKAAREKCLNGKKVKKNRKWLQNILLAESSSEDESNPKIDDMLRLHKVRLRCLERFYQKPKLRRFKYYGAGLVVNNSEVTDLRPSVPLLPVPKGVKSTGTMNGNKRPSIMGSFSQPDMAGPSMSIAAPKISPRKPKKKKQPPPPLNVSLAVPEMVSDNGFQTDLVDFQQDHLQPSIGLGSMLDGVALSELPQTTDVDLPNVLMSSSSTSTSGSAGGAN